jgi:hypothetical protein
MALALGACERRDDSTTGYGRPSDNRDQIGRERPKESVDDEMSEGQKRVEKPVEHAPAAPAVPTGAGGGPIVSTPTAARELLAGAQCDRLRRCGEVAKGKAFESFDACISARQAGLAKSWTLGKCQTVDSTRLETCLRSTRELACEVKRTEMPADCRADKVCTAD